MIKLFCKLLVLFCLTILNYLESYSQTLSKFPLEVTGFELSFHTNPLSSIKWNDQSLGIETLKHLDPNEDNKGFLKDELSLERPFDVEYRFYDYSDCCGGDNSKTSLQLNLNLITNIKPYPRFDIGFNFGLKFNPFGRGKNYYSNDTRFGERTIYFKEKDVQDEVQYYDYSKEIDTILYFPRTKLASIEHSRTNVRLGSFLRFRFTKNPLNRNQWSAEWGFNGAFSEKKSTTIRWNYYDYSRLTSQDGYGNLGDIENVTSNSLITLNSTRSSRTQNFEYSSPRIFGIGHHIGVNYSRQFFKKWPIYFGIGFYKFYDFYYQDWAPLLSTQSYSLNTTIRVNVDAQKLIKKPL